MISCPYNCGAFNEELNLLVCRPEGQLVEDLIGDIATCRECIQKAGLTQINRFHDLTGITSINLSFEDMQRITYMEAQDRSPNSSIKACYLVPNPLLFGTIRMYAALIESSGVEVHVSYDLAELATILNVDPKALTA